MATFIDGFEQFAGDRGAALMRLAGYAAGNVQQVAGRKPGGRAMSTYRSNFTRNWTMAGDKLAVGFAVKYDARGPLLAIGAGANNLYMWIDPSTGLLNMGTARNAGTPGYVNPLLNRWYYIEMVFDRVLNTVTAFVNGKQDISIPFPAFITGDLVITYNPWGLFSSPQDFGTRIYDDIYINDGPRIEPIQVTTRNPTADGAHTDWSFVGAATRWQAVSPEINELDKFIYTAVDGNKNTFVSAGALPDSNPIKYLQLITMFRKATSDPMSLDFNIDEQVKREANISRNWTFRYTMFDAAGYDAGNIGAADFGVKLILG